MLITCCCAQFPGLVNGATIDWFLPWPEEALTAVAGKFIDSFAMACTDQVRASWLSAAGIL